MIEISKKISKELAFSAEKIDKIKKGVKNIADFKGLVDKGSTEAVTDLIEIILGSGIRLNASDVHLEPEEEKTRLRIRVDGILQDVTTINNNTYKNLVSRIKLLSGIKLNVTNRPQDGRFSIATPEKKDRTLIEIRTSVLPSENGESIVLRILNPKSLISLEGLGLREDLLNLLKKEIKKPDGMIIVTGPTGSGKTTTLYACLKAIKNQEIKIITIEDPIEYHLEGISQTQIEPTKGYDFATGLQALMRQDPNVILVGEIRDLETAKIALQAALTGHLVFTTLHTNDAAGTVARLTNLGAKLSNIGPAINVAIAQRLVRKVCQNCKQERKPSKEELVILRKAVKSLPKSIVIPKISAELRILEAKGCKKCNLTGYQGRIGIFEILILDDEMERFILKNPSIADLKKEAVKKGMVTIHQDGIIKVLQRFTTFEEIGRVAGE